MGVDGQSICPQGTQRTRSRANENCSPFAFFASFADKKQIGDADFGMEFGI